jgi:subtilisin family serine protease
VAGLAALVYARFPTYTPNQAASAILDNAQDLGSTGWDIYYGCGRIDAFQALWEGGAGDYPVCLGARVWSATGAGEQGSGGAGEPGAEEQGSRRRRSGGAEG